MSILYYYITIILGHLKTIASIRTFQNVRMVLLMRDIIQIITDHKGNRRI